ncbi:MAG: Thioredoxin C-1 [Firmicutes bacterium ADurb.Bin300]|nr:MAG: Thioredoxin C-1 [Firmicutes bacterium ADurb.Bin300]HOD02427.1 thioredoxin [Clostridiales bacterium]
MSVVVLNNDNFTDEVLNSDKPVLVDFWASWCGPCKMLAPIVEEVAGETTTVKVAKVNVDEEPELARRYRVMSIPTLVLIKDGKVVKSSVGVKPKNDILAMLE